MSEFDDKPKRKNEQQSLRRLRYGIAFGYLIMAVILGMVLLFPNYDSFDSVPISVRQTTINSRNRTIEAQLTETAVAEMTIYDPPPTTPFDPTGTVAVNYTQTAISVMTATIDDSPPTSTPSPTMTRTPGFATTVPCAWMWHTEPLPDITQAVQVDLDEAEIDAETDVYAFGEICSAPGTQGRFGAMETDFDFIIEVSDINDTAVMGDIAADILQIIVNYPPDETPGPNLGRIIFLFYEDDTRVNVTVRYNIAMDALGEGLTGTDLFNALQQ